VLIIALSIILSWTVPHDGEGGQCTSYKAEMNGERFYVPFVPSMPGDTQSVMVNVVDTGRHVYSLSAVDQEGLVGEADSVVFYVECDGVRGDVNGDGAVNVVDISDLIYFVFRGGVWPR
jgi:hypothetical protein